jgi:elongation factor P--(R)-beta-lysine ligase
LPAQSHWFSPGRHADRRPFLLARNRIIAAIRAWFAERDFLEADCAALAVSPGNEAHLHAFATELIQPDGSTERRYLHTSPEFAAKKLLAAGETRIFTLGHVWRNRERTPTHSPEFTMLEWYRAREDYEVIIADTLALVQLAARMAGTRLFRWRGREADPFASPQWLTVNDAFKAHAGVDLLSTIRPDGTADREALAEALPRRLRQGGVLVGHLQPHPVGEGGAQSGQRPRHRAL